MLITIHVIYCIHAFCLYEGESNENLKFVIKNRNFAPLSCKFVTCNKQRAGWPVGGSIVQMHEHRHSISIKMAAPLETCTREEQRYVNRFLRSEGVKPIEIHRRMKD